MRLRHGEDLSVLARSARLWCSVRRPASALYPGYGAGRNCVTAASRSEAAPEEALRRTSAGRPWRRRAGAHQQAPEIAVAGAVVEDALARGRSAPSRRALRGVEDGDRFLDLVGLGWKAATIGRIWLRMDAPHARVAELARGARGGVARRRSASPNSVTTLCDGVLAWAWQAAAISSLARSTSGCANWPFGAHRRGRDRAAVRRDEIHQAERDRLDARMRGDRLDLAQGAVGLDQRVQRHATRAAGGVDRRGGAIDVGDAVDLGQHHVGQARARRDRRWSRRRRRTPGGRPDARGRRQRPKRFCADSTRLGDEIACSASAPTGAPSSQSSVTSNTGPSSACRARLFVIRASTPA